MRPGGPIRIAVVIPQYGLVGGAESFVYDLTERLARRGGYDVHVLAKKWRPGNAPITFHKVPVIPFPKFLDPISFAYFAGRCIRQNGFDWVHSHERIFAMNLFTFHGIPHETWIKKIRGRSLTLFDRATVWVEQKGLNHPGLQMVMPVSSLAKEELLKRYALAESKVSVISPGIDMERFNALDPQACRQKILRRHNLSQNDVVVLFVSMNFELKRLDLVIKGVAGLLDKEKQPVNLKLLVVGKGKSKKYEALARELGIGQHVVFAGVTREVEAYYLASDIFALPSGFDTFGLAVLEAMAAGLPVIVTRSVGARDMVQSDVNGFVLSENPAVTEITAALAVLMDREKRLQMGAKGRQVALRQSWDGVVDRVVEQYRQMVGKGHQ